METTSLTIDLRAGETVSVDGPAEFRLIEKTGTRAKIMVVADKSVTINRPQKSPVTHARLTSGR
jgi:hypothetical protein